MRIQNMISWFVLVVLAGMLLACSTETPARMNAYLGPGAGKSASSGQQPMPEGRIQAGLLVINDTTAPWVRNRIELESHTTDGRVSNG